jgi:hypothetical protein
MWSRILLTSSCMVGCVHGFAVITVSFLAHFVWRKGLERASRRREPGAEAPSKPHLKRRAASGKKKPATAHQARGEWLEA